MIYIIAYSDIYCIFVGYNGIGAEGAKSIAGALLKNQALTKLNLSHYTLRYLFIFVGGNQIGDDGAKAIADALPMNQLLTQLNIGDFYHYNITIFTYICRL